MNTTDKLNQEPFERASVPGWVALIIVLIFWVILLPLVQAGIPWAFSFLGSRYGWSDGRPATWNLVGLIPIAFATTLLIWLMILHFSRIPKLTARYKNEMGVMGF